MAEQKQYRMRVRGAAQVVQVCAGGERFLRGKDAGSLVVLQNATVVVDLQGEITAVGPADSEEMLAFEGCSFEQDIDGAGLCVLPGFVDGHTHPVWAGSRVEEFGMKLAGASYMEIHAKGGGIQRTVNATVGASEEDLLALLQGRLERALRHGTVLLEAKSGYGLTCEPEMKLLRVLHRASRELDAAKVPEIVSTYLGAHSVPPGVTSAEATRDIVDKQIPELVKQREAGLVSPANIDVFLEKGVFNREETREILAAGEKAGMALNFHGDEINPMQSGELAGEMAALAVSHLERVSDDGIAAMALRPSFAVLLPTTAYILRLEPPPARKLIDGNVPVALGSDYNPNAHCISMPFVMHLACVLMHMTLNEALIAATLNSAASLGRSDTHGSIEKGKRGDLILLKAPQWEHIVYELVDPPILHVVKGGRVAYTNPAV